MGVPASKTTISNVTAQQDGQSQYGLIAANSLQRDPSVIAVVGDSMSLMDGYFYQGGTQGPFSRTRDYIVWGLMLSGYRHSIGAIAAEGGARITTQLAGYGIPIGDQLDKILSYSRSGTVHILAGTNDINTDVPLFTIKSYYTEHVERLIGLGVRVICGTILGVGSGYASYSAARQNRRHVLNDWICGLPIAYPGSVFVADYAGVTTDPASASASPYTNFLYDGLHPNNRAAIVMGAELARVLNNIDPEAPVGTTLRTEINNSVYDNQSDNIWDKGFCLAAPSSGVAGGYSANATGATQTNDVVAREDGFGNDQVMAVVFSAASQRATVQIPSATIQSRLTAKLPCWVQAELVIKQTASAGNLMCNNVRLQVTGATRGAVTATCGQYDSAHDSAVLSTDPMYEAVYKTPPMRVDSSWGALTQCIVAVDCRSLAAAAGGATIQFGRVALWARRGDAAVPIL